MSLPVVARTQYLSGHNNSRINFMMEYRYMDGIEQVVPCRVFKFLLLRAVLYCFTAFWSKNKKSTQ